MMTEAIPYIALLLSLLATLYARWAGKAAQRANEIALHNEKLKIFQRFQEFHMSLVQCGAGFHEEVIWRFISHAHLSEFYYPHKEYERLKQLVEDALKLKSKHDEWAGMRDIGDPSARDLRKTLNDEFRSLIQNCKDTDTSMRDLLRLDKGKASSLF